MLLALLDGQISQEEYLYLNNIDLEFVDIPKYIYGFICKHKENFLIAINKNLSDEKKKKTILHELAHFELNHCEKDFIKYKIEDIEDEADRYMNFLLEYLK